jgi:uncharacterized repeat protein (TIGR01451 family)
MRTSWLALLTLGAVVSAVAIIGIPDLAQSQEPLPDLIISEVAWSGTAASGADEWIELYNRSHLAVNIDGWVLSGTYLDIELSGSVAPNGFFLLERNDDDTVSNIPADQIYIGVLANTGDSIYLDDHNGSNVDSVNSDGGHWPAGSSSPDYLSMERISPWSPDADSNWTDNDTLTRNGLDANGDPINGTPHRPNSPWHDLPGEADLNLSKHGPSTVLAGDEIAYTLTIINDGDLDASGVVLTDTLPGGFQYAADDSGFPMAQPVTGTLVWQIAPIAAGALITFNLTATVDINILGMVTNQAWVVTTITETVTYNNYDLATTRVITAGSENVLIDAVYYDGYETNEPDEAVRLINIGGSVAELAGWTLTDGLSSSVFPEDNRLNPGQAVWLTKNASAFFRQFGFMPDYEVIDNEPDVPDLEGTWPGFSNSGDEVILRDNEFQLRDVLVYEAGNIDQPGWYGPPVSPYIVPGVFAEEGQILYRSREQRSCLPLQDTNTAADWAQNGDDPINGRKVRYPGWDLDENFFTQQITETAAVVIAIAPDNAFSLINQEINSSHSSIQLAIYTFRNVAISDALINALGRGVSVTVLLEGSPTGGLDNQEKYICKSLEEAGGQCWFMINDENQHIHDRYRNYHAKYMIFDDQRAIVSSENLSPDSLPDDDKSDGTWGRRGVILQTNALEVVEHLQTIWNADFDSSHHADMFRWNSSHPQYGDPPAGMVPITLTGGTTYTVRFPSPVVIQGDINFEIVQSPENSLRNQDGLIGLLNRTGTGDTIFMEGLVERPHWGPTGSDPASDPNPRLESILDAARRGVTVRLLLDAYFDDPDSETSNRSTCRYANEVALYEHLDLRCARSNPTGLGIHNKMILVELDGQGYVHVGSINGTELSSKGNREIAIQIKSDEAFALLAEMFWGDWPHRTLIPVVYNDFIGPAHHLLVSEVLYDPYGPDDAEFIEIVNPTTSVIDISGYSLGDALNRDDFEDVRRFPANTVLGRGETVVVATTATAFTAQFGFAPDFEILNTDPLVPDLIDDPTWGDPGTFLRLGNLGDEVLLRDPNDHIVDALAYGTGSVPGLVSCGIVSGPNHSLERFPYWRDTDDCLVDFREWPFPNPGDLP